MPFSETGPFRGVVEKLLVSPTWREKGVARRLMGKLEDVAWQEGRWLIVSFGLLLWIFCLFVCFSGYGGGGNGEADFGAGA